MRVLYSFPLRIGRTGIGNTAWQHVNALVRNGVEVELHAGSIEREIPGLARARETLVIRGLRIPIRVVGLRRAMAWHDRSVAHRLRRLSTEGRVDVIHCWPSGALATLKCAKDMGIPTVLERASAHTRYVFGIVEEECRKLGMTLNKSHYAALDNRRLEHEEREFRLADKLVCPSDFVVQTFLEHGFDPSHLIRHRYGYDPAVFSAGEQVSGKQDPRPPFKLLYVGDCSPLKGLHYALQAWLGSRVKDEGRFMICGRMHPEYEERIREYLEHPSIVVAGFCQAVHEKMVEADALILPSLAEGSALVTYEARACGCVLLVSTASGAPCRHEHDALVHDVGDVETIREHIELLAFDRGRYETLQRESIAGTRDLTWDKGGRVLLEIYESLMALPTS